MIHTTVTYQACSETVGGGDDDDDDDNEEELSGEFWHEYKA